ncbi:MAG: alpha/beta hydrolase [Rhodocyclaceae bacterium]|nr:alpha/beta hydrolase [Rhodocyclaceae bacterium]
MTAELDNWRTLGRMQPWRGFNIFMIDSQWHDAAAIQKPTLVLIHGYPTSSWDFSPMWHQLSVRFRLVTADLLGMGFSSKPLPHQYTIGEQADLMQAVMQFAGVGNCHILAHDYGDTVTQELLARDLSNAASRYHSVTLLNGGLFPETHRATAKQKLMAGPFGPLLARLTTQKKLLDAFSVVFGAQTKPDAQLRESVWQLVNENKGLRVLPPLLNYIRERRQFRERWLGALTNARMPLALINGSSDPVSGAHMVVRFRELLGSNHFIRELAGIGHYPQVEAPQLVLAAFEEFLDGLPQG